MRVLIVEDEKLLADSLKLFLEKKGFDTDTAYDGETGEMYARTGVYDLLILDVMLPGTNGYEIAKRVRGNHMGVPILMLTAKASLEDRITGLDSGADYYLPKPFDMRELLACIHALLRRQGSNVNEAVFGNTSLDFETAVLSCKDRSIRLSAREFEIMRLLMQSGERNLSKDAILVKVWGYDSDAVENHVEVYIGFLRKKLAGIGSNIRIESVRRMGYHLEADGHD